MTSPQLLATILRGFADQIESGEVGCPVEYFQFHHTAPVTKPEYGDQIVDHRLVGWTVVFSTLPNVSALLKPIRDVRFLVEHQHPLHR